MTLRDRIILLTLSLLLVIYGGYKTLWIPTTSKIITLEKTKTELQGLTADITPVLKQTQMLNTEKNRLQKAVDEVKTTGGKTLTKEEFLLYLGETSTKNTVEILGFNDLGTEEINGIYKAKFDFELQGTTNNINKIFSDIDNMGVKYSVGSISFRQVAEYDYLKRFFDNITGLPWYKEAQEEIKEPELPQPKEEIIIPQIIPEDIPIETPAPLPTEEPKNINDRLSELLKETSFTQESPMRIAITLCFIMTEPPNISNSFMVKTEGL